MAWSFRVLGHGYSAPAEPSRFTNKSKILMYVPRVTDTFQPSLALSAPGLEKVLTYQVCRVPIADVDTTAAAWHIVRAAASGTSYEVHLCNAYTLSLVDRDPLLRDALMARRSPGSVAPRASPVRSAAPRWWAPWPSSD
jgi:hypothetical protein